MSPGEVLNSLGPYPIVQAAVALVIVAGFVIGILYGLRVARSKAEGPTPAPMSVAMPSALYMDGPLVKGLELAERLVVATEGVARGLQDVAKLKEDLGASLAQQRHDLRGDIQRAIAAADTDHSALEARLRVIEPKVAVLEAIRVPPPRR